MSQRGSMHGTLRRLHSLWMDEAAPTSVEYGVMVGLIAVVIVAAVGSLGESVLTNLFQRAADATVP